MAKFIEIKEPGKNGLPYMINTDAIEFFQPCLYDDGWEDGFPKRKHGTRIYFTNSTNIADVGDFLTAVETYDKVKEMICENSEG